MNRSQKIMDTKHSKQIFVSYIIRNAKIRDIPFLEQYVKILGYAIKKSLKKTLFSLTKHQLLILKRIINELQSK